MPGLPLPRLDDEEHNALLRRALPLVAVVPNASDISVVAQCVFLWRVSLSLIHSSFFFDFPEKKQPDNVFFFEIEKKKISRERIEKYSCFYCHY
jgi:hypothetical protein